MFELKPLIWLGSSLEDVRDFPEVARRQLGRQLMLVQAGELPTDWKPIRGVGVGVQEIRIHVPGEYRVAYVVRFAEAVYVLHAFSKKSQKTVTSDLRTIQRRYSRLLAFRLLKEH